MASLPPLAGPVDVLRLVVKYPLRWLVPAVLVTAAAIGYAETRSDTWEASQALIVRNEAAGNTDGPGKFRHADEMKALLETLLELAKSRSVLEQALVEVGPPEAYAGSNWPSDEDIFGLGEALKVVPPKGAEFGKTEVFYLKVQNASRARAVALATAICNQLEARYGEVRNNRAVSMVAELAKAVEMAEADVREATQKVATIEKQAGGDLAELRNLHQSSGESDLRRRAMELETELRQAQIVASGRAQLFETLSASQADQGQLLATPNGLLDTQPALKRLKDALQDAQLRTAQLLGNMSELHPLVRAARVAEQEINHQLSAELNVAVRGVEMDSRMAAERVEKLEAQVGSLRQRLEKLAGLRAEYSSLLAEAEHRTKLLEESERALVEAKAGESSARTASLVSRLDTPDTGTRPVGPGQKMIVLAGIAGGLATGFGVLLLSLQPAGVAPANTGVASGTHRKHAGGAAEIASATPTYGLSLKKALAKKRAAA